jgi:hypothetical protein
MNWTNIRGLSPLAVVLLAASACSVGTEGGPMLETGHPGAGETGQSGDEDDGDENDDDEAHDADDGDEDEDEGDEDEDGGDGDDSDDGDDGDFKFDVKGAPLDVSEDACPDSCLPSVGEENMYDSLWLLHLRQNEMMRVDVETGEAELLCELAGDTGAFKTLTFTRDNRLMASDGLNLFEIEPCTCQSTKLGQFNHSGIYGIAPDDGEDLFGISANADSLVRIDSETGETTEIGPLGISIYTHGATWFDDEDLIYAVKGGASELYTVDPDTGSAELVAPLSVNFVTVGLEMHPESGMLYGCTSDAILYQVDPNDGQATEVGPMGVNGCTNLGAPWADGGQICLPSG